MSNKSSWFKKMLFPFFVFSTNRENVKNAFFDSIENTKNFVKSADWRGKDIYGANMELAEYYYNEKKFFDAKVRYRIASHFKKDAIEPLLGLAYVEISAQKYRKALKYLKMALMHAKEDHDVGEIRQIIRAIESKK